MLGGEEGADKRTGVTRVGGGKEGVKGTKKNEENIKKDCKN